MQASQPEQPERLTIPPDKAGARLDRAIADWLGLSRAAALRLLEHGGVMCNGRVMGRRHKGDLLQAGDQLALGVPFADGEVPLADASAALTVLAEGEGWVVVNKPAGVAVRPHALGEAGTVLNAVVARYPGVVGIGEGGLRSGIVHRLDTQTSGTLAVATHQAAWDRLRNAFATQQVRKRYEALVYGSPPEAGQSQRRLHVAQHAPARVEVVHEGVDRPGVRDCSLAWRVTERFGDRASRIEVDLHTGFLHQIRAMMSDMGYPVIGDCVYANDRSDCDAPRQMLHAKSLRYEELVAEAALPADMLGVMAALRG